MSKEPKDKKQDAAEIDLQEFVTEHGLSLGDIPRDPETGQILYDQLTDEQREDLKRLNESAERMTAAATKTMKAKERADENKRYKEKINEYYKAAGQAISTESIQRLSESLGRFMQWFIDEQTGESWRAIIENLKPISDLISEIHDNREQLDKELQKDCYDGRTTDDYLDNCTPRELLILSLDEDSDLHKALEAIKTRKAAQQAGRERRRQIKEAAAEQGAIMELRGGTLTVFSQKELWNAFAPGRISKIGTLNPDLIDQNTGRIKKRNFDDGEIIELPAADISYKSYVLLSAIMANSVDNYRETFVKDGSIKFYVKGVLDSIEVDARTKTDGQLNMDRKTAGVLFLEKQFEPMLTQIGTTIDGSRYSVLNYEGYDANSDTMTIRTPYLFTLWRTTQKEYETARKRKKQLEEAGKKPTKKDLAPIKVNSLFKKSAAKEDDAVFEIATFITNKMLQAGKSEAGKVKKTEIKYETLISKCPRLKEKLKAIDEKEDITEKGTKRNKSALYNTELRKIAKAFNLIMNPAKCDATAKYDFISISPARENKKSGKLEFVPPTKSMLDGKIVIKWRSKD